MKRFWLALLIALTVSVTLAGCGSVKYPALYTLSVPPPPDPPAKEGVRASVAIREFRSPAYLRQGPIVYRPSAEQVGLYEYHRWAVDPRETVTNAVAERLRASGSFALVKMYDGRSDVGYLLTGQLEKLEEVDYEGGVRVEVALSAYMRDLHTGATVWTNSVSEKGVVSQRSVPAVVAEMSRTLDRAIQKLVVPSPAAVLAAAR